MWESICLTLMATAGNNIGKVLQKKGTVVLPPLSFKLKMKLEPYTNYCYCRPRMPIGFLQVIHAYAFNKLWITGFLMDIFGAVLMLRALSQAPVSVIQPVSGCGLAILCIFSHFYLKEVMNSLDWVGIVLAGFGTIGNELVLEERSKMIQLSLFSIYLGWFCLSSCCLFIVLAVTKLYASLSAIQALLNGWLHVYKRRRQEQELMQSAVVEEIIFGLESGILFGMASVISKMGFMLSKQGFSKIMVPLCISFSICCSATGFIYQTRGLKHGRAIVVSTCAAVASIVTGVLAGMLALGESMPSAPVAQLSLLLGWVLIIVGVIILVSSDRLMALLPRPLRRLLRSNLEKSHNLRRSASVRVKDPSPSTVIHASTLHHLIASPAKEKA